MDVAKLAQPSGGGDLELWRAVAPDRELLVESWNSRIGVVGTDNQVAAIQRTLPHTWSLRRLSLAELEVGKADDGWTIVWTSHLNDPGIQTWNSRAYESGTRWLPILDFDGNAAVVGPLIIPPDTPCFECYRRRRAASSARGSALLDIDPPGDHAITNRALCHMLASLAVLQLELWCAHGDSYVPGAISAVTFTEGLDVRREYVMRVPRCRSCRRVAASTREMPWTELIEPAGWEATAGGRSP